VGTQAANRSVLVVEDDPDIAEVLTMLLPSLGYEAIAARNGAEALRLLEEVAAPCLILLDLMMPVMNGWDFRAEQLRDPELAKIPVVVMTGAGIPPEKMEPLGADGYLRKPIELEVLAEVVARWAGDGAHLDRGPRKP
jgi:CheY-like chemotaxis protein